MHDDLSKCNDKMVETLDKYFERAKEHMDFLYPGLDLIRLDLFKVIKGDQLVDDDDATLDQEVSLL